MTDYTIDQQELEQILNLANPRVKKNTEIVTPDSIGSDVLYHIALDKRAKFFPNISKRAGMSEDNTMTRIHVAPTLAGCWFGYAGGGSLAANYIPDTTKKKVSINSPKPSLYKGGFYIHEIPFRCALKPNTNLVYDSDLTDEIWLVTYNEFTKVYSANIVGMLFPHKVTYLPRTGKFPEEITTLCLKVEKGKQLKFSLNNVYYKPTKNAPEYIKEGFWMFDIGDQIGIGNLVKINEKDFNEYKLKSAGMLSFS